MREIRTSGSEGGGAPKGVLPTSIAFRLLASIERCGARWRTDSHAGVSLEGSRTLAPKL
jgi:hypothetical protein